MPYSKSTSREDFELEYLKLGKLAKKISYKSSPLSYDHKQLIFQSCIFLLCARIEDYTKNLIEGIVFNYKSKGVEFNKLPINIRTKVFIDSQIGHFRNYYNSADEKKLLKNVSIKNPSFEIINDSVILSNHLNANNVISSNKYPSIKNLKILYHRIGIDDIVLKINANSKRDLKTSFESFLSLRESIAHQSSSSITFSDLERHFENVMLYINHIDRIVYKHITKESGATYWK